MQEDKQPTPSGDWPRWSKRLITLLFLVGSASLIWNLLPREPYPTDMSRVGGGTPTLVLAHESHASAGMEVMELMNQVRDDYRGRVDFLVAHLGTPVGDAFARRHAVVDGSVLLFDAAGKRLALLHYPGSTDELRQALDKTFSSQPAPQ